MNKLTADEILQCSMYWPYGKDTDADTVEDYLLNLLLEVVKEQEGFDGKRPFGNSDWLYNDIGNSLAYAGIIDSKGEDWTDYEFSDVDEAVQVAIEGIRENLWRMRDLDES